MQSILITPKDNAEFDLLSALLTRLNIKTTVLSDEEQEDTGLGLLLQEANRHERVSREAIFSQLRPA